jgi:ribose 1,5-bisphosphokinase
MNARRGTLVLVVGPSGAGKDTLLSIARTHLRGDERFVFARRVITRPPEAGEEYDTIDESGFAAARDRGAFALDWAAHGLSYGIPMAIAADLEAGLTVCANVSRSVVADAAMRFAPVHVCSIFASPEAIEQRLRQRARPSDGDIVARMNRAGTLPVSVPVTVIKNDDVPEVAGAKLVSVLLATQNESSSCLPAPAPMQ